MGELENELNRKIKERERARLNEKKYRSQKIRYNSNEDLKMKLIFGKLLTSTEIKAIIFTKEIKIITKKSSKELNTLIVQLKKIGNNLNQIAYIANAENKLNEFETILKEIALIKQEINIFKNDYQEH